MADKPEVTQDPRKPRRPFREVWPMWREGLFILGSLLVSAAVAGVTGWGSWGHIVHIGRTVGEPSADWLPVAIDGMMFNGTILVAVDRFRGRVARPWAVASLWLGSVLTLAFNIASAWERGVWAMLIAVTYSVALLCTVEAIFHPSRTTLEQAMAHRQARREAKAARKSRAALAVQPVAGPPEAAVTAVQVPEAPPVPTVTAGEPETVVESPAEEPAEPAKAARKPRRRAKRTPYPAVTADEDVDWSKVVMNLSESARATVPAAEFVAAEPSDES